MSEEIPKEVRDAVYDLARAVEDTMGWDAGKGTWDAREEADRELSAAILLALRSAREEGRRELLEALRRSKEVMPPPHHAPETWCDCAWCSVARALSPTPPEKETRP